MPPFFLPTEEPAQKHRGDTPRLRPGALWRWSSLLRLPGGGLTIIKQGVRRLLSPLRGSVFLTITIPGPPGDYAASLPILAKPQAARLQVWVPSARLYGISSCSPLAV